MKKIPALICCAVLLTAGVSFAHEGEDHQHHHDGQMAKLHKMMPKYASSREAINAALAKGDLVAVNKETAYLLSTTADLKKSKPHKRLKELEKYQQMAGEFEQDVKNTAESARKGDLDGARSSFAKAQNLCNTCHAGFRD